MKYHPLGHSGLMVSEICLGSMTWGSQNTLAEARQQLDHAIDEGVNFVDTAEMYPTTPRKAETSGVTEEFIGAWLKDRPERDRLIIATKVTGEGNPHFRDGGRVDGAVLREALEGSLRRLQTDVIDLYQLHWPNRGTYHFRRNWTFDPRNLNPGEMEQEIADLLGEVALLQREGKLRTFGLSNESTWGTMKFLEVSRLHDLPRVVSVQNEYSLICRHYDLDMAEMSVLENVGLLAFSPLAAGALSGKYIDGTVPEGSRRSLQPNLNGRYVPQSEAVIARYAAVARKHGLDPAQMALAFCLGRPFMTSVIIGATSMEQLKTDLRSRDVVLDEAVLSDIHAIYRENPMPM